MLYAKQVYKTEPGFIYSKILMGIMAQTDSMFMKMFIIREEESEEHYLFNVWVILLQISP